MEITITTCSSRRLLGIPDSPSVTEFKRVLSELQRPWRVKHEFVSTDGMPIGSISELIDFHLHKTSHKMTTSSAPSIYFEIEGSFTRK